MLRTIILAVALATAPPALAQTPSAEALALGEELARQGLLGSLLPMVVQKETEELVAANATLSEADKATLRTTASETARAATGRLYAAQGRIYAQKLKIAELRALTTFNRTPAATRFKAVQPDVIAGTTQAMEGLDFKKDVMVAFCAKTGKGCER